MDALQTPELVLKSRAIHALAALCLPMFLTGCVAHETYGDPGTPESELALVEGYWRYLLIYDEEMHIVSVDGRRKREESWFHAYSVSLPSGTHWLQFAILRNGGEIARCAFEWKFEARHSYKMTRLRHDQFLLAHPASSPYKTTLSIEVTAPDKETRVLALPAVCAQTAMCRQKLDCPPSYACQADAGLEFGTCTQRDH